MATPSESDYRAPDVQAVAELLGGAPEGEQSQAPADELPDVPSVVGEGEVPPVEAQPDPPEAETPVEVPASLDELAEKTGLSKADLYKVEIPLDGENRITLGEFKDRVKDLRNVDELRAQVEDKQSEDIKARVQFQQEMQQVAVALQQGGLTEDNLAKAKAMLDEQSAAQDRIAEASIPNLDKARPAMRELAEQHGIPGEVFDSIHFAGFLSIVHRLHTLESRIAEAKSKQAKASPKRPKGARDTKAERAKQAISAAKAGGGSSVDAARIAIFGE